MCLNAVNCLDALIVIETGKGTSHSLGLVRNEDIDFFFFFPLLSTEINNFNCCLCVILMRLNY